MRRSRVWKAMWGWLLLAAIASLPALAQSPSDVLIYPRFKTDQKRTTIGRVTNTGSNTNITLLFVCPGDSEGFCPFLRTTFELERNATRAFRVRDFDPPCREGFFVLVSDDATELIGSYEIFKGRVGKLREADNAISLSSFESVQVLGSDLRGAAGRDSSNLILIDLVAVELLFDPERTDPVAPQPVEITGISGSGETRFTFEHGFTCYRRVQLDQLRQSFRRQTLGEHGSIVIRALEREDGVPPYILGAMGESGKGSQTERGLFDLTPVDGNGEGMR